MATSTQNFGTNTALTVTNLHSLANGSWWQSAAIDNGTVKGHYAELFITILTTTSAASAVGTIDVYMAGSTDAGTDYAGGASGSQGSYTPSTNDGAELTLIAALTCDATETSARTYKYHVVINGPLPEDFAIVIENNSGQALGASTNAVEYRLNKYDSA